MWNTLTGYDTDYSQVYTALGFGVMNCPGRRMRRRDEKTRRDVIVRWAGIAAAPWVTSRSAWAGPARVPSWTIAREFAGDA